MEVKRIEIQRGDKVHTYEVGGYLRFEGQDKDSDIMTEKIVVENNDVSIYFSKEVAGQKSITFRNFPFIF